MASTEQRNGFRLPWASDTRIGAPVTPEASPHPVPVPDAEEPTPADPTTEAPEMQEIAIPDPRPTTWPDADPSAVRPASDPEQGEEPPPVAERVEAPAPTRARHDNPLVTGLIRAMRDAARTARQEAAARFSEEAKARIEAIHAQSADEAADLRKQADSAIVKIRDWSKAEMARIREETDQQIADRRRRLESDVAAHAEQVEHRIERVQMAISDFEQRMDAFFERLLAEEDPARLASLAERLPEPPALDGDLPDALLALGAEALDPRGAAAAEAEAFAELDRSDLDSAEGGESTTIDADEDMPADADVVRRLGTFTGPSAATSDAIGTRLAVVGLVSVASIAGFKRALARSSGVRSVAVASGPTGDFIFTVTHDPATDLASTVAALDGFGAVVTGDADGVVTVTATDPDRAL